MKPFGTLWKVQEGIFFNCSTEFILNRIIRRCYCHPASEELVLEVLGSINALRLCQPVAYIYIYYIICPVYFQCLNMYCIFLALCAYALAHVIAALC